VGSLAANVIPVKASVALDLRLVVGNDWKKQQDKVVEHVRAQGYHVTEREPTDEDRENHPKIIQVVRKSGYNAQKTTQDPVVKIPTAGGSLPLFLFEKYLAAKTISVPVANHDNNQHAENENIRIRNLWDGIETMASIMMMK
jgi:acetylornithine deacetylase/succinyl-diaminopimelate desuccinylase-like protein